MTAILEIPEVHAAGARFEAPGRDGIGRIVVDRPDDSVNSTNLELVEALGQSVRAARDYEGLRGLIVVSAKNNQWIAGADLNLVLSAPSADAVSATSRRFQEICDELSWLPCTTVAAINGTALGGGFEVALACDYRVAADSKSVSVGLPEVSLGLLPAGGGTQRLPRLVGLAGALDLILGGKRLDARRARRAGLLDEVVHPVVLEMAARAWALKSKRDRTRPLKLGPNAQSALALAEQTRQGRELLYRQARDAVLKRTHGHYPSPLKALEAIRVGMEQGLAAGLEVEATAFGELAMTETARNLIWLFMATQRQKRDRGTDDPGAEPRTVDHVGVVGAGFMGSGIAEVAAVGGMGVRVRDVDPRAVAKGMAAVRRLVDEAARKRRVDAREARAIVGRVSGSTDYSGFGRSDLVIEAVFEDLAIKKKVVQELEVVVRDDAVIASNTSALPIGEIAKAARHPERVVGMHFFSPVHRMPLLEIVRGEASADWAVATAVAAGNRMGKTVIVVGDGPGFYTSRVLGVVMNEATLLLAESADMQEVDRAWRDFGFPVGPFVLYDEVGLQVAVHAGETVLAAFHDRLPYSDVAQKLVASGATGKRSGRGFYLWHKRTGLAGRLPFLDRAPSRVPNPQVAELMGQPARTSLAPAQIQERLTLLFVNEAARCLEEGVLRSPTDGDLGAVMGLGFPPFRGGPFRYADALGLSKVCASLERLAEQHGARFRPTQLLQDRANSGQRFYPAA